MTAIFFATLFARVAALWAIVVAIVGTVKGLTVVKISFPFAVAKSLSGTIMQASDVINFSFASLSDVMRVVMVVVNATMDSRSACVVFVRLHISAAVSLWTLVVFLAWKPA